MSDPVRFLIAMSQALSTMGLYGDDHPATARALDNALERLRDNHRIAITEKRSANQIFSFGRDHGYYGRILSQAVVAAPVVRA